MKTIEMIMYETNSSSMFLMVDAMFDGLNEDDIGLYVWIVTFQTEKKNTSG